MRTIRRAGLALWGVLLMVSACRPATGSITAVDTPTIATPDPTAIHPPTTTPTAFPAPSATATAAPIPTVTATPADPNTGILFTERGNPDEPRVAITIDDFIYSDVIQYWLIEFLRQNPDVKVTLFPVGKRVPEVEAQFPGIWREWLEAGHEIGFHSLTHERMDLMTPEQLRAEIAEFNRLVGEAVGDPAFRVRWARATYGNYGNDRALFAQMAQEFGLTWVRWSVIPSHASYVGHLYGMQFPDAIHNGDIALFHVRWQDQYWIERYVEECRRRGIRMVSLSEMRLMEEALPSPSLLPPEEEGSYPAP